MEQGEALVDLLLLVIAVVGKCQIQEVRQEQVALLRLRWDRNETSVSDERTDDPLLVAQLPQLVVHGGTLAQASAVGGRLG